MEHSAQASMRTWPLTRITMTIGWPTQTVPLVQVCINGRLRSEVRQSVCCEVVPQSAEEVRAEVEVLDVFVAVELVHLCVERVVCV